LREVGLEAYCAGSWLSESHLAPRQVYDARL
jgi:hypothetical protein